MVICFCCLHHRRCRHKWSWWTHWIYWWYLSPIRRSNPFHPSKSTYSTTVQHPSVNGLFWSYSLPFSSASRNAFMTLSARLNSEAKTGIFRFFEWKGFYGDMALTLDQCQKKRPNVRLTTESRYIRLPEVFKHPSCPFYTHCNPISDFSSEILTQIRLYNVHCKVYGVHRTFNKVVHLWIGF